MDILNMTIGGLPVGTLVVSVTIVLSVVWLWSRWDEHQARKRQIKKYQAWIDDLKEARVRDYETETAGVRTKLDEAEELDRAKAMEEAQRVLREIRLPARRRAAGS